MRNPLLHNVVRSAENVRIGSVFAFDGAWDRKAEAIDVKEVPVPVDGFKIFDRGMIRRYSQPNKAFRVTLRSLGRYYADGDYVAPKRASEPITLTLYYFSDQVVSTASWVLVKPAGEPHPKSHEVVGGYRFNPGAERQRQLAEWKRKENERKQAELQRAEEAQKAREANLQRVIALAEMNVLMAVNELDAAKENLRNVRGY